MHLAHRKTERHRTMALTGCVSETQPGRPTLDRIALGCLGLVLSFVHCAGHTDSDGANGVGGRGVTGAGGLSGAGGSQLPSFGGARAPESGGTLGVGGMMIDTCYFDYFGPGCPLYGVLDGMAECFQCSILSCAEEFDDVYVDESVCAPVVNCIATCACGDCECYVDCRELGSPGDACGAAVTALVACLGSSCQDLCGSTSGGS